MYGLGPLVFNLAVQISTNSLQKCNTISANEKSENNIKFYNTTLLTLQLLMTTPSALIYITLWTQDRPT